MTPGNKITQDQQKDDSLALPSALPVNENELLELIKVDTSREPSERYAHAQSIADRVVAAAHEGREFSARSIAQVLYSLGKTWSDQFTGPDQEVHVERDARVIDGVIALACDALFESNRRDLVQIVVSSSTLACRNPRLFVKAAERIVEIKETFEVRDAAQLLSSFAVTHITDSVINHAMRDLQLYCVERQGSLSPLDLRDLACSAHVYTEAQAPLLDALIAVAERCWSDFTNKKVRARTFDALLSLAKSCGRELPSLANQPQTKRSEGEATVSPDIPTHSRAQVRAVLRGDVELGQRLRRLVRSYHLPHLERLQGLITIAHEMRDEIAQGRGISAWNVAQLMYGLDSTLARSCEEGLRHEASAEVTAGEIREVVPRLIEEVFHRCNAQDLAQIASGCVAIDLPIDSRVAGMMAQRVMEVPDRKIRDCAQVATSLARMGWGNASSPLFRDLPALCVKEEGNLRALDVRDLAQACMLCKIHDKQVYEVLFRAALRCRKGHEFKNKNSAYRITVNALEELGRHYPDQAKAYICNEILRRELDGMIENAVDSVITIDKTRGSDGERQHEVVPVHDLLEKYRSCRSEETSVLTLIESAMGRRAYDLGVDDIARIAEAVAEKGRRNIELCNNLVARWSRVKWHARPDETATFAWAVSRLAIPQDRFFDDVSTSISNNSPRPEFSVLAKAAWAVSFHSPELVKKICSADDLERVPAPHAWLQMYHALLLSDQVRASQAAIRPRPSWNLGVRSEPTDFVRDVKSWLEQQGINGARASLCKPMAHVVADIVIDAGGGRKVIAQCHTREEYLTAGPDGGVPFGEHQLFDRLVWHVFGAKVFHLIHDDFYGSREGCGPLLVALRKHA